MLFSELAQKVGGTWIQFHDDQEIQTLEIDSRKPGMDSHSLFFSLSGPTRDGHDFLFQAYEKGVRNFVVSRKMEPLPAANILQVTDVLRTLQAIVRLHREHFSLPVIGITGSNGKTIVKEWLSWILGSRYQVAKSPKSYNSQIGVPLSLWGLSESSEIGVFEAGVSKSGEMSALARIIQPTVGLITNIGEAHASGFPSLTAKLQEKLTLFENSELVFYCWDHSEIRKALDNIESIGWSISDPEAQLYFQRESSGFGTRYKDHEYHIHTKFTYQHDIENLLHAVSVAIYFGLSDQQINEALEKLKSVSMRLQLKSGANQVYILDDTYNNDLAGLRIALEYLQQQPFKKRRTVVLSDILQSGRASHNLYREVNQQLESHQIQRLIGVGPEISNSRDLFSMEKHFFPTTQALIQDLPAFADELVLVKGARGFELERLVSILEEKSHGTILEVNMEAIVHNLNEYRRQLKPETKVMVMVKAFAYGGGLNEIAHLLQFHKVDYLGVAYLDEGIQLRRNGITLPIMVMNPDLDHLPLLAEFDLQPEIYSLTLFKRYAEIQRAAPPIHLKFETGMHRLGITEGHLPELESLLRLSNIRVAGVFTHFSSSDNPVHDAFTAQQANQFDRMYARITGVLGYEPIKHAINSAGIVRWPQFQYNMVRLGIGLYGYDPAGTGLKLRTVSSLKARVSQLKQVTQGDSIGYNRMGVIDKPTSIAVLSLGYADGYLRSFGNGNAYVVINGKRARTIGNVCMDMVMVDVTGMEVSEGDEVTVFGAQPDIAELADWAQTIPYEILTTIGQRVKRVFISE